MQPSSSATTAPNLTWFAIAAVAAGVTDVTVLGLMGGLGYEPLSSRLVSFALATLVGWLVNRTWTYSYRGPPTPVELMRYVLTGAVSMLANYAAFVLALILWRHIPPLLALAVGYAVAVSVAFIGYCRHALRA